MDGDAGESQSLREATSIFARDAQTMSNTVSSNEIADLLRRAAAG